MAIRLPQDLLAGQGCDVRTTTGSPKEAYGTQEAGKLEIRDHMPHSLGSSTNALQEIQPVAGLDPGNV